MEQKYRHKVTGDEITYKDGVIKTGTFTLEIGCKPNVEYWEEVIEKDFEILEYIDISKLIKKEDSLFYRENTINKGVKEAQIAHFRINKIKRLRDGEIFEIGDTVICDGESFIDKGVITSIVKDKIYIINNSCSFHISSIRKLEPILITEDCVKLYDNENFVWQTHDYKNRTKASIQNPDFLQQVIVKYAKLIKNCKFFRDKEKAEEYIFFNKPCLSIEDLKAINHANDDVLAITIDKLKELVKSKSL